MKFAINEDIVLILCIYLSIVRSNLKSLILILCFENGESLVSDVEIRKN